jgi:DNA-directed RNA polymerase specialized sigma24 family protein
MGDTGRPRRAGRRGAEPLACRAPGMSYAAYYRSLVQLAALLTGDACAAEAAVADALAAVSRSAALDPGSDDFLRYLQRQVIVQCRRARRSRGTARHVARSEPAARSEAGSEPAARSEAGSEFARLPVVIALRGMPPSAREAIVLTHYLDLPPAQAAAIAGVSETVLRANLTSAMRDLGDLITGPCPDS